MLTVAGQAIPVIQLQVFAQVMIAVFITGNSIDVTAPTQKQTAVFPVVGVEVVGAGVARPDLYMSAGMVVVAADGYRAEALCSACYHRLVAINVVTLPCLKRRR
jgi:hypothetical protein